jgi:hypothetical protein
MTLQGLFERLSLSLKDTASPTRRSISAARCRPTAASCCTARRRVAGDAEGARKARHRPHHFQGHPRSGRPRRRAGEDAGVARLRRLVGGQIEHELKQNAWLTVEAKDAILFDLPPTSACPRRCTCSASITRGSPTRRDMPDKAARAPYVSLRFRFAAYRRRGRASRVGTAHPLAPLAAATQPGRLTAIERLVKEWKPGLAGGRGARSAKTAHRTR